MYQKDELSVEIKAMSYKHQMQGLGLQNLFLTQNY